MTHVTRPWDFYVTEINKVLDKRFVRSELQTGRRVGLTLADDYTLGRLRIEYARQGWVVYAIKDGDKKYLEFWPHYVPPNV